MDGEGGGYPSVVKIDVAKVSVRTTKLLLVITNDLNQTIAQKQAKFPARMVEVKTFTINTGLRLKIEDHLFHGKIPKRLVFCLLVTNEEFNGRYTSNLSHSDISDSENLTSVVMDAISMADHSNQTLQTISI